MKKPKFSLARMDSRVGGLLGKTSQKTLAKWAIDCAERVMPYFEKERPGDDRPRMAIGTLKNWIRTGEFHMAVIRKASLDSHAAARECDEESPARSAARAAGQAVATAHVPRHSLGAALYAQQAVFRASDASKADAAVQKEREWQYRRLLELREKEKAHE